MHNGHISHGSENEDLNSGIELVPQKPYQLWRCTLTGELRALQTGQRPGSENTIQYWELVNTGDIEGL